MAKELKRIPFLARLWYHKEVIGVSADRAIQSRVSDVVRRVVPQSPHFLPMVWPMLVSWPFAALFPRIDSCVQAVDT